jgi:hypothetical protein
MILRRTAPMIVCAQILAAPAAGAPLLRAAEARITFVSPTECEVALSLTVEGAADVEHRVDSHDTAVALIDLQGARQAGEIHPIGRTRVLRAQPQQPSYTLRYRASLPADRAHRCPVWLPTVPADGQSRAVALQVDLPAAVSPGRSMPALTWTGSLGTATLGHLPAFVHVPFAVGSEAAAWDVGQVMDVVALGVFAVASAAWIWRRKR